MHSADTHCEQCIAPDCGDRTGLVVAYFSHNSVTVTPVHCGKYGPNSDPGDPSTWQGDQYDMTARRRWFEACYKTTGYLTVALAFGAAGSGLMRYRISRVAVALVIAGALVVSIVLEARGLRQDTYRSVYGNHADHPYNKTRRDR